MASKVCSYVKNPSQKQYRAAMAQPFHQQSKKKAAGVKPSKVKVMLIPNGSKSVARDIHQKKLDEKKVEIFHIMSALVAKKAIVKAFISLHLSSFIYLKVDNAQRLTKDVAQDKIHRR